MYIEKVWPSNNANYRCLMPESLANQTCALALPTPLVSTFLETHCQVGNLQRFTSRYLAGGFSLKQGRLVSRKRLSLMRLGFKRKDELAESVTLQSERYRSALQSLRKRPLTLGTLCEVHKSLDPHHHNGGRFRDVQNWIGGRSPDTAHIVPPPPENVSDLMTDWINYVNNIEQVGIEDIIMLSNQFILIHPFNDGNGRLNRAIVDALLSQIMRDEKAYISPFLFRLAHQHNGYLDAPSAIMQGQWQQVFDFWDEAIQWSINTTETLCKRLIMANSFIQKKLTLRQLSQHAATLLSHISEQPIVTPAYLSGQFGWTLLEASTAITELLECGILNEHRVKEPINTIIYDCQEIFDAWMEMDEVLFRVSSS
ncbi:filamentation induced by cAMP protein Fic [Paraglaciecola sp. T6c]|uniref:Fic family protein n=1 Tax=Pseudoalteromonas atlantica (strain T6c / ATCC BAA-1087) TaxID=3042615 RepID=UPI00005C7041|nr:Fic family protein [Paraglaciecola sp. T6c]ABG42677.1 filamentation induced by cAMP protein Fic [Paraglaciecola sp. T6c]